MVNFFSISMLLVLLEPVNHADSKYVFAVWIGSQIREIYEKAILRFLKKIFQISNQKK